MADSDASFDRYALFTAVPLIGHVNPLLAQATELQRRGWRVAFGGFSDLRDHVADTNPSLPFVDFGPLGDLATTLRRAEEAACRGRDFWWGTLGVMRALQATWTAMYDGLSASVAADRPDVMGVDLFSAAALCVADSARVPVVVNNPCVLASLPVTLLPPADDVPFMFSGRSIRDVGWGQRVAGPFLRRFATVMTGMTLGRDLKRLRATRGLAPIAIDDLLRGRTTVVNSAFGIEYARPLPSHVHMCGAMIPAGIPPLPDDLAAWLADGPPVVYANLGTLATASDVQLASLFEALASGRFRALWILKASQAERLPRAAPPSMRVMPWGPPPIAVLAHPNVRVFVSHCGTNSVHESLSAGTPIVGIPMFVDQIDWAQRVADAGVGVWLDKSRFTGATLRSAIERVLADETFRRNIPAVQRALAEAGGVSRAADLIAHEASIAGR